MPKVKSSASHGASKMENQHKHITGYRDLSPEEIALMNEVKAKAQEVGALVAKLKESPSIDQRWVNIGNTELQQGFMALTRSVAQPTTF